MIKPLKKEDFKLFNPLMEMVHNNLERVKQLNPIKQLQILKQTNEITQEFNSAGKISRQKTLNLEKAIQELNVVDPLKLKHMNSAGPMNKDLAPVISFIEEDTPVKPNSNKALK